MIADTKAEDEFCRSMKPLQTLKNTGMGYSAAYHTMRRRSSASEGSLAKGEPEGTARGRARSVVLFEGSIFVTTEYTECTEGVVERTTKYTKRF